MIMSIILPYLELSSLRSENPTIPINLPGTNHHNHQIVYPRPLNSAPAAYANGPNASGRYGAGSGFPQNSYHPQPIAHSMISEQHYASCPPISPYPLPPNIQHARMGEAVPQSQASNDGSSSSDQHRRK